MDIYINDFYNNPSGKSSAAINISILRKEFDDRYNKIQTKLRHSTFVVKKNNKIFIIVKVPSSVDGIEYDVVFEFKPSDTSIEGSLSTMPMRIFSNSPSFTFTYANAYMKRDIFIKSCKKKLPTIFSRKAADVKNPYHIISYDFSVYCGLKYLISKKLLTLDALEPVQYSDTTKHVLTFITRGDVILKKRSKKKEEEKIRVSAVPKTNKNTQVSRHAEPHGIRSKTINTVKKIKTTKISSVVKKVKRSKKI